MKIAIASDHAGVKHKTHIIKFLEKKGYKVLDLGPTNEESVDYPDFAHPLAQLVEKKEVQLGILLCGSGNGINMSANKHQYIRSALCWEKEVAKLARLHNDANILALPARFISEQKAKEIVDVFINTSFEGGRHERRVKKISSF